MKPKRGSNRDASKQPNIRTKPKAKPPSNNPAPESTESVAKRSKTSATKTAQNRTVPHKSKAKWSLMPRSSIVALETILDLSTISTLALRQTNKNDLQQHLGTIKKRFVAQCEQLKVPVQRRRVLEPTTQQHQEQMQKSLFGQKSLSGLEERLSEVVDALEKAEEQIATLQRNCQKIQDSLEDEEEKASELLQLRDQAVLDLLPVPSLKQEETLETRMRNILSNKDADGLAGKLGDILQTPNPTAAQRAVLLRARKYADQLFDGN